VVGRFGPEVDRGSEDTVERLQIHFGELGSRDCLRLNPFHADCADERQSAVDRDLSDVADVSIHAELVDLAMADDVQAESPAIPTASGGSTWAAELPSRC
jgi:hypothetical protein